MKLRRFHHISHFPFNEKKKRNERPSDRKVVIQGWKRGREGAEGRGGGESI